MLRLDLSWYLSKHAREAQQSERAWIHAGTLIQVDSRLWKTCRMLGRLRFVGVALTRALDLLNGGSAMKKRVHKKDTCYL